MAICCFDSTLDWDEKWVRALVAPLSTWGATTLARAAVAEPTLLTSQPDTRHAPVLTQRAVSRPAWTWRDERAYHEAEILC